MPNQSISSRQAELLNSNFLDLSGSGKLEYGAISLDSLSGILASYAIEFAELARRNLDAKDRTAGGYLSDSIVPARVVIFGQIYQVDINVASYYKFVDQGVRGWADEKGGSSPYQFRNFTGKSGKKTSAMIEAIQKWIIAEGLKGTAKVNSHPKASRRDQARAKLTDATLSTAFAISRSIKKKGLRASHFWTDAQNQIRDRITEDLSKALKVDIINNIIPK